MYLKFIFPTLLIILFSCSTRESEKLSPEEKYIVDTMYSNRFTKTKLMADSLCTLKSDSFFSIAIDSIKKARIDEIELLTGNKEVFNVITE